MDGNRSIRASVGNNIFFRFALSRDVVLVQKLLKSVEIVGNRRGRLGYPVPRGFHQTVRIGRIHKEVARLGKRLANTGIQRCRCNIRRRRHAFRVVNVISKQYIHERVVGGRHRGFSSSVSRDNGSRCKSFTENCLGFREHRFQ